MAATSTVLSNKRHSSFTEGGQSVSAEAIANNYDLLVQILVCLPVKSLVRLKSVSKAWHSLITDPKFSCRILARISGVTISIFSRSCIAPKMEHGLVPLSHKSTVAPFKSLNSINQTLKILQSCNGLLLCRSLSRLGHLHSKYDYLVYNSTIKQFDRIPPPTNWSGVGFSLAFDPIKSAHYKVVCVGGCYPGLDVKKAQASDKRYRKIEIYSSQTQSWRLSGNPFLAECCMGFDGGVFCNGAIHWLPGSVTTTTSYFNVEDEKLGELPIPPKPEGREDLWRCTYFEESRGHLHLIQIYGPQTTLFSVYEIESDYSRWFVKYRIDLDLLKIAFPEMIRPDLDPYDLNYYAFSVLCIVREAEEEESYMVLHIPEKAIRYNLNDGSFKKICDIDPKIAVDIIGLNRSFKLSLLSEDLPDI